MRERLESIVKEHGFFPSENELLMNYLASCVSEGILEGDDPKTELPLLHAARMEKEIFLGFYYLFIGNFPEAENNLKHALSFATHSFQKNKGRKATQEFYLQPIRTCLFALDNKEKVHDVFVRFKNYYDNPLHA